MLKHNPGNERIKRFYFIYLKEAKRQSEQSVDAVAKALARFEEYTHFKDFKAFHHQQAIAFKNHLAKQKGQRSGQVLSKATLHSTLSALQRFFLWLAGQPGYKSQFTYSDADYFSLSGNDVRVATAHREQRSPTMEQVKHVIATMPCTTEIELRNRALTAFTLLTGARVSAMASMKLQHIDFAQDCVHQDARQVNTKFRKTFTTFFLPVGMRFAESLKSGCNICRRKNFGAMMIRCFLLRELSSARHSNLNRRGWIESIGKARQQYAKYSVRLSRVPG